MRLGGVPQRDEKRDGAVPAAGCWCGTTHVCAGQQQGGRKRAGAGGRIGGDVAGFVVQLDACGLAIFAGVSLSSIDSELEGD